jgi:hypothetical protein
MVFKVYKEDQNEEDSNPGVSIKVDSAVLQGHISFHSADSSLENSIGSLSTRESDNSKFNYCKKIDISTPKTSILNEKKHPEKKKELRKDIKNIQSKTSVPLKENEDTIISIKNAKSKSITNIKERSLSPAKRYLEFSLSENLKNHCKNKDPEVVVNPTNKENWDSLQNCYSTDRKPKMHRISSLKKIGRIPLADITSSYHKRILKPVSADQVCIFFKFKFIITNRIMWIFIPKPKIPHFLPNLLSH